jgi:hypothetical protein
MLSWSELQVLRLADYPPASTQAIRPPTVLDALLIRMLDRSGGLTPGGRSWAQKAAALLSSEEFDVQVGWSEIGLRRVAETRWKFLAREVESA